MDYRPGIRSLLREAGRGAHPVWERPFWTVSRTSIAAAIDRLLQDFACVEVITDGVRANKCDTRCREARGSDCACSCAGSQHGIVHLGPRERIVGDTTIVDTTIARWRRVICGR